MKTIKLDSIRFAAPVFAAGVCLVALSSGSLKDNGHFEFVPNPGALAKSSFGRTIGMALQGPITKFWDRGVSSIEQRSELVEGGRVDEKLFNFVTQLKEDKSDVQLSEALGDEYQDYAMARIEKKLELAWKMDPRNFANYAIYQMFLWEGFNVDVLEAEMSVRELSLETLAISRDDKGSPMSILTAGQAAYDLVFAARTTNKQSAEESIQDIDTYSKVLVDVISDYDLMVASMQGDGRWEKLSEVKRAELNQRKAYLEHLNQETQGVLEELTRTQPERKGGHNS